MNLYIAIWSSTAPPPEKTDRRGLHFFTGKREKVVVICVSGAYNTAKLFSVRGMDMQSAAITMGSVFFNGGWARFMGTGFFGMEKIRNR